MTSDAAIRTIDDLPETGLIFVQDFVSPSRADQRLIACSLSSWKRKEKDGEVPRSVKFFGKRACHAEQIRALALGRDWRRVVLPKDALV